MNGSEYTCSGRDLADHRTICRSTVFSQSFLSTQMSLAAGFRHIVQARSCSLTAWSALKTETGKTLGKILSKEILCYWGAFEQIVTDKGSA